MTDVGAPSTITNTSHPAPLTVQNGIPLGAIIPLRIKNKIWNDQFIDLKFLLPNFKEENVSIQIENNAIQFSSLGALIAKLDVIHPSDDHFYRLYLGEPVLLR